ncbi:MAG: response regulator [bacterium]
MIKVLIANDLPIIGRRLRQALAETRDIVVAGEVSNGTEVLHEVAKQDFDVILLDISISGGRGVRSLASVV